MWGYYVLLVPLAPIRYSYLPPQSKDMHSRLIGNSELSAGVSVDGRLSLCVGFVMNR